MDVVQTRQVLQKLLERYDKFKDDKSFLSNEKQICESLILPFVRDILQWDTSDPSEFRLEEQRAGKRPDYLVYYQGMTQFIVEAKAATKNLFEDETALKQALEYGYNADKDFVILTNFKQIVILAPKIQWRNVQEAAISRIDILKMSDADLQTLLCFEKEYWISSAKNNQLYQRILHHKKSVPVDNQLLVDMKNWREMLLTNIQRQNHKLNFEDEQEFAEIEKEVQKFIDRLVFICCCEDKEIHHEPTLKRLLNEKKSHYSTNSGWLLDQIQRLFSKYRKIPDSDLFDASAADRYLIEDLKLIGVLTDLREPKGRPAYNFDEIDEDILGKVYENFIGHVQTGKKRFKEKEDIGKRKKEGIYYTPKYIVEYIVNNTVREYVKGKSYDEILNVKILDPACGSGSFLLRAFNVLVEESAKALKRPLTYAEKKKLLLSCIYGVDLDERAVEITKLTFSLKLAQISEGLPVLADNIRHGNSLIDDKSVAGEYLAFKWEDEFKDIMASGGFDVVIGNPPYGAELNDLEKEYLDKNLLKDKSQDTANYFISKALRLSKQNGVMGFIIPKGISYVPSSRAIRELILSNALTFIIDVSEAFGVSVQYEQLILIFSKTSKRPNYFTTGYFVDGRFIENKSLYKLLSAERFLIWVNNDNYKIIDKILDTSLRLSEIAETRRGLGCNKYVSPEKNEFVCLKGQNVQRYAVDGMNYVSKSHIKQDYEWLITQKIIAQEIVGRYGKPIFGNFRNVRLKATLDSQKVLTLDTVVNIFNINPAYPLQFILAIINSTLI
ncbi:MAG: N-6 DNA methylase, partial [Nanoarchaeota archaeon]